jgi:hypothetical protein
MASTYSTNLKLELIGTGDQSGTWGATTNTNLGTLLEQAIAGYATQAVTDSGVATVLTIPDGASSTGRNYVITLTGALTAARTVEVPAVNKPYIFFNNTTGGYAVTVKVSGQTGVTIANGKKAIVYTNTTDVIEVANAPATEAGTQTLTNKTLTSPLIGTVIGGTSASSSLTLQSTSGVGTSDSILFKVGNNGATTAMTVTTAGNVGIGTTSPTEKLDVYNGSIRVGGSVSGRVLGYSASNVLIMDFGVATGTGSGTDVGLYNIYTGGILGFGTNNTERMRIDSSGNVGIGITAPGVKLDVVGTQYIRGAAAAGAILSTTADPTSGANGVSLAATFATGGYGPIKFFTTNTEAMRITAAGLVGIGTSAPARLLDLEQVSTDYQMRIGDTGNYYDIGRNTGNGLLTFYGSQAVASGYVFSTVNGERMRIDTSGNLLVGTASLSGTAAAVLSLQKAGGTIWQVGPATSASGNNFYVLNSSDAGVYLATGNTSWTANSDERLKTDLVPIENAASKVSSLRAVTGRFKTDEVGKSRAFLIAQEVQAVLPEAVNATNPDSLGVQYTDVIPLLVAAIKELSAKNDALEARLSKLENVP